MDYNFAYQEGFLEHIPTKKINGPFNELKEILLSRCLKLFKTQHFWKVLNEVKCPLDRPIDLKMRNH